MKGEGGRERSGRRGEGSRGEVVSVRSRGCAVEEEGELGAEGSRRDWRRKGGGEKSSPIEGVGGAKEGRSMGRATKRGSLLGQQLALLLHCEHLVLRDENVLRDVDEQL